MFVKYVNVNIEKKKDRMPYIANALIRNEQGQKQCSKCKQWKDESEFNKKKGNKDGLSNVCKICGREQSSKYREKNRITYYTPQSIIRNEQGQKQCNVCKQWKDESCFSKKKDNADGLSNVCKICKSKYEEENREVINAKKRTKYGQDNKYRLKRIMSSAIYCALKGRKSERHWEDLVNYNIQDLKEHLESQFDENMTWDNMGNYWEIDHIIPQNLFSYESEQDEQFKICWSLANLRPLEKSLNRSRPKDGRDIPKEQAISILGLELYNDIMGVENKGGL